MNYQETLDYLFKQLPMYQRKGAVAYKKDLTNTLRLCKQLDNPEKRFKSVHIAGTNGKGSVSHMLASVFQNAGYKTGLYTSPHLKDFRERIRINGQMISQKEVIQFVENHQQDFEKISLSFFEWTVGLAFKYFEKEKVDIAIVEVGMGGRLDSTNVLKPELSVITNISLDHTQFLGNTIEQIAKEKAGIIKQDIPIVIGESQKETMTVFQEIAIRNNASISWADKEIKSIDYETDLKGNYQQKNIKTALQAIKVLQQNGWRIIEQDIRTGLINVASITGLKGRWQILFHSPLVICDTGHNVAGITLIVDALKELKAAHYHIVFGSVKDKKIDDILSLLPKENATYYFCRATIPRAIDANCLKNKSTEYGLQGLAYESVQQAYQSALKTTSEKDVVFVGGSTFVVAEVI